MEMKEIGEKYDGAHKEWREAHKEYLSLQTRIRKTVQLPIDARISELSAELQGLRHQKREANKSAYMASDELQELKKKLQETDEKVQELSNQYWKIKREE